MSASCTSKKKKKKKNVVNLFAVNKQSYICSNGVRLERPPVPSTMLKFWAYWGERFLKFEIYIYKEEKNSKIDFRLYGIKTFMTEHLPISTSWYRNILHRKTLKLCHTLPTRTNWLCAMFLSCCREMSCWTNVQHSLSPRIYHFP